MPANAVIQPPQAEETSDGDYSVTVYTTYGFEIQERVITLRSDSGVDEEIDVLTDEFRLSLAE